MREQNGTDTAYWEREFARAADATTAAALAVVCAIGSANAFLQLIVTVVANRTLLASALASAWVLVWWLSVIHARQLAGLLRRSPQLLVAAAAIGMAPIAVDDGLDGTLATQALWLTWVAAITVTPRMTVAVAVAMSLASAAALIGSGMSQGDVLAGPDRFQAILLICSPLLTALVGLALVGVFRLQVAALPDTIAQLRAGGPACSPALTQLLRGHELIQLPAGLEPLTAAEREVVAALRDGRTPKQIAHDRGRSLATVRTQIKRAKRKVGARTQNELIARTCPKD